MKYIILLLSIFCLTACQSSELDPIPIPDRELVYERWEPIESEWESTLEQLGFFDADGSNLEIVEAKRVVELPVWSADGTILYGLSKPGIGYPAYWEKETGSFGICDENLPYFFQIEGTNNEANPYEVLLHNARQIIMMDLSECREVLGLVDFEKPPEHYNYEIEGFSYYAPTQELVFGLVVDPFKNLKLWIMHLDVKSRRQTRLPIEGIHPTWSPDGTRIAYIGWDGIYTAQSDGSNVQRLVARQMIDPDKAGGPSWGLPLPRWSSDGEWLVYHMCTDKLCSIEKSEIYKVRVSGGEPERILIGGVYPSWRP